MNLILNIDTALERASVSLATEGRTLSMAEHGEQKEHAAWLHAAISELLAETGCHMADISAVAVSIGPGSYTGLRVGLSAAKGLCYACSLPLIAIGTLELLAYAAKQEASHLISPVIDARRMDVYTAVFTAALEEKLAPREMHLTADSFADFLKSGPVLFVGTGIGKLRGLIEHSNARFSNTHASAAHMAELSHAHFTAKRFVDLVYTEPRYLKEFYGPAPSFA
ncbi:MAG TPA: tRNA (adenosine(37)-N6)-threonylcarbamoyltransferase complex dimerization subunit type 1 TsaB [Chitinophagaceae bacterium]|nr:tRNA (adenosine(37)-N6)-threonylcarbamoyltransferase complex dimerization subunit type 1 TsaB [Chitinophagaceae bacterium]